MEAEATGMKNLLRSATALVSFAPTQTTGRLVGSAFVVTAVALLVLMSPAVASVQTFSMTLALPSAQFNPCVPPVGEDVFIQGTITMTFQQNFDEASGSHFDIH